MQLYHSNLLSQFPELIHGSTTRKWWEACETDWKTCLAQQIGLETAGIFWTQQVHGKEIRVVNVQSDAEEKPEADALITDATDHVLVVNSADCVPILLYDPENRAVAAVHAGWEGTVKKIVQETIKRMGLEYKTDSSDLFVSIGPAICGQCYDVSGAADDRLARFERLSLGESVINQENGQACLDLPLANELLCREMGVPEQQIEQSGICTLEDGRFASYRRDPKELEESILTYIGLTEGDNVL